MTDINIRPFSGLQPYEPTWQAMQSFTDHRNADTFDEIWLLEHPSVFTQGLAGKAEHVLNPHDIPIVQTDRGGQITYHGPGQLMLYLLLDLNRLNIKTRQFVRTIEQTVIDYLGSLGISAEGRVDAPGIYVGDKKIASIGLRVRRGYSYHGIAFNIDTDLTPFSYINPCGFQGLRMTSLKNLAPHITQNQVKTEIITYFLKNFGYNQAHVSDPSARLTGSISREKGVMEKTSGVYSS